MKKIVKHTMGVVLALTLATSGAMAYATPDFTDVAAGNWAYAPVMQMADEGIIKGTSSTTFAPEMKVSAAMWLTLLGRTIYDADAKAAAQMGDVWHSAYVRVAESKGLLTDTNITQDAIEDEISRYDMAATTYAAIKLLGGRDATVDTAAIKDYSDIPQKYLSSVNQMYATGLIKGDGEGRFNGAATMRRDEAATVMVRLLDLKAKLENEANKPIAPETPRTGEVVTFTIKGKVYSADYNSKDPADWELPMAGVAFTFYYKDGRALASGISSKDGTFSLEVTVDKADYSPLDSLYYIISEEYIDSTTGAHYQSDLGAYVAPKPYSTDWDVIMYAE